MGQQATYTQIVKQADPMLVWQPPTSLAFGEPLSAAQLNASALTPGVFTYTPAAGTIPPAGTSKLLVQFVPANPNFLSVSSTVDLVVRPAGASSFLLAISRRWDRVILPPGGDVHVDLTVEPVGDFHQPVMLSCRAPEQDLTCSISPEVVRPVASTVTATVTVKRTTHTASIHEESRTRVPPSGSGTGLMPALALLLGGGSALARRRFKSPQSWAVPMALFGLLSFQLLTGCGSSRWGEQQVIVTGHSLLESKTTTFELSLLQP